MQKHLLGLRVVVVPSVANDFYYRGKIAIFNDFYSLHAIFVFWLSEIFISATAKSL